jgi:16S rRNA (uracil1498-N3)-methyltransferase
VHARTVVYNPVVHRFFAPDLDPANDTVVLPRDEAEHLPRVLRLCAGDTVAVFDGRGREFLAQVATVARRDVRVRLLSPVQTVKEPAVAITLVQSVLKGDKMDDLVRDAVMLGVSVVQPIVTTRAETTVAALTRGARVDRWKRVALASAKQSGRAVLPEIRAPLSFENWLTEPIPHLTLMLVEPGATAEAETLAFLREWPTPAEAAIVVGPEGGWIEAEWSAARARGARLVTLGQRVLRADAAPVAALSVLQFLWNDL